MEKKEVLFGENKGGGAKSLFWKKMGAKTFFSGPKFLSIRKILVGPLSYFGEKGTKFWAEKGERTSEYCVFHRYYQGAHQLLRVGRTQFGNDS